MIQTFKKLTWVTFYAKFTCVCERLDSAVIDKGLSVNWHNIHDPSAVPYSLNIYFKREKFHGFHRFMSNLKKFNHKNFVFHYYSILCFCSPQKIYHKNAESHESTKILILEILRLYDSCAQRKQSCMARSFIVQDVYRL